MLVLVASMGRPMPAAADPGQVTEGLTHYGMTATFDPATRTISGEMQVTWQNTTGEAQDALHFRLYPNASYYENGALVVDQVIVDGVDAAAREWADPTVLEVDLGESRAPNSEAVVSLTFKTTIPATSGASYGILGGDQKTGWWLADWYPILAGWEPGAGWYLEPPTKFGDPTFAEVATYELALTAPSPYLVVGSGEVSSVPGPAGETVSTLVTEPGRDLTISLVPDGAADPAIMSERDIAGIDVRLALPGEIDTPGLSEAILDIAADVLPVYEQWMGEYPGADIDITSVPLAGAGGVSWHGIVWLDLEQIAEDGRLSAEEATGLRFVLSHELSHQWISGIVGSNNNDHGFMSEGLSNVLAVLAIRETDGPGAAQAYLEQWIVRGYRSLVERGEDGVADARITNDTDIGARGVLIYGKGALGFEAVRQAIGDDAFFRGLLDYATTWRYGISGPEDLRLSFEHAAGRGLGDLWAFWFEQQRTTVSDIDSLVTGFTTP